MTNSAARAQQLIVLDAAFQSFANWSGGDIIKPFVVYSFESYPQWEQGVQAFAMERMGRRLPLGSGLSRAAVTIDGVSFLYDIGGMDALRLTAHEAWHAYSHRIYEGQLPVWLEEALACRAEGLFWNERLNQPTFKPTANPARRQRIGEIMDEGRLGTLLTHLRQDPMRLTNNSRALDDYYARAWVLGVLLDQMMVFNRLSAAVDRVPRTTLENTENRGVQAMLGVSVDDLDALWRETARGLVRR